MPKLEGVQVVEQIRERFPDAAIVILTTYDTDNDIERALRAGAKAYLVKDVSPQDLVACVRAVHAGRTWVSPKVAAKLVAHVIDDDTRGKPIAEILRPDLEHDYFVLKPKHSGFYSTTLDILLQYLGARTLILTGLTADICVLFTANDAYMRDFHLLIPSDCVASLDPAENGHALEHMRRVLKADIRPSTGIDVRRFSSDKSVDREPRESLPSQRGFRGR